MTQKKLYIGDLQKLFTSDLQYIYYAEKEHAKVLARIQKATTEPKIVEQIGDVLNQCVINIERLEKIFGNIEIKPRVKKSRGIEGMVSECKEILNKSEHLTYVVIDAALLSSIQRILFYKIGAYKTLKNYARLLSNKLAAGLFDRCYKDALKSKKRINRLIVKRVKPVAVTLE